MAGEDSGTGGSTSQAQDQARDEVVRQAVVLLLEAPRLKGVTVKNFVRFNKKRE